MAKRVVPVHKYGQEWWLPVLSGVVSIAVGILAVSYPDVTLRVIGIVFGIGILLAGVTALIMAFDPGAEPVHTVMRLIIGFIAVLAGAALVVRPDASVLAVLLVIALWLLVAGVANLLRGITIRQGRWSSILLGLVEIAGGVILLSDTEIGVATIALIAGIVFIVRGVLELILGFELRRALKAG